MHALGIKLNSPRQSITFSGGVITDIAKFAMNAVTQIHSDMKFLTSTTMHGCDQNSKIHYFLRQQEMLEHEARKDKILLALIEEVCQ